MATNNPTNPDAEYDCRYWPDEPSKPVSWRLVSFKQLDRADWSCELCGHAIAQIFYVESNTGVQMKVGCECVNTLLAPADKPTAALMQRRANRAAKQWRDKKPAPRDGEERTGYIMRRLREMGNAVKASRALAAADALKECREALRAMRGDYEGCSYSEWQQAASKVEQNIYEIIFSRIEQQYIANRYDFNRPIWDVRKI